MNRQLKEQHRREHPPGDTSDRSGPDPSAIPPAAGGSADDGESQAQSLLQSPRLRCSITQQTGEPICPSRSMATWRTTRSDPRGSSDG